MMKKETFLREILSAHYDMNIRKFHNEYDFLWGKETVRIIQKCEAVCNSFHLNTTVLIEGEVSTIRAIESMLKHVNHRGHVTFIKKTEVY